MRAKLCFGAALAAMLLPLGSCQITAVSESASQGGTGTPIGQFTGPTGNGNCSATIFENASRGLTSNGVLVMNVGETVQLSDSIHVTPAGCVGTAHHFTSSDTTVVKVGLTSGLITAVGSGTAQVCDVLDAAPAVQFCLTVQVNGGNNGKTPTSVVVSPNPDTYPVGTVKTPTVTVNYSDNTSSTTPGSFTCTSTNSSIVAIVNASTCQESGVSVGSTTITFCAAGSTTICTVQNVTVTAGTQVQVSPASFNFSIGAGCQTTQNLSVSVNGTPPTGVTVTSSAPTVATVSGSGGNWTITGLTVGTTNLTVAVNGATVATVPVTITNTACASGGAAIDYTPHGGTIALGASVSTLATCNLAGGASCGDKEFWSSNHPEIHDINATDGFQAVNGFNFPVGPHGKIVAIASGSSIDCVQASLTNAALKACWPWVTP